MIASRPDALTALRRLRRAAADRACRDVGPLSPSASAEWVYGEEDVAHRSGGFFRVIGLTYSAPAGAGRRMSQLILDQREVGVLGLAVRGVEAQSECLVQLKCEPGNMGSIQLAPTCQATQSNLSRLHGGSRPPGSFLLDASGIPLSQSLQSEQGTRFWHKRNLNIVWRVDHELTVPTDERETCTWTPMPALRQALAVDYLVNTDLRSVLATADWQQLMGPQPFADVDVDAQDVLTRALDEAWRRQPAADVDARGDTIVQWLTTCRAAAVDDARPIAVAAVGGVSCSREGVVWRAPEAPFAVRHVRVSIRGREREHWDQPLIDSRSSGEVCLVGYRRHGVMRFMFQASWEPGLHDRVELHPSVCIPPGGTAGHGDIRMRQLCGTGLLHRQVWQSDEGGRFWRDRSVYQVIEVNDPGLLPEPFVELTPREIGWLAPRGVFTNEARSAISLLLSTSPDRASPA